MTDMIGTRIRERMSAVHPTKTQSDMASAVNMATDALSRALNGQRHFATLELVRIANYLQTSLHWLATGEPDPAATRVAARHTFDAQTLRHESVDWSSERTAIETVAAAFLQAFRGEDARELPAIPASPSDARTVLAAHRSDFVRSFAESVEAVFGVEVVRIPEAKRSYSMEVAGRRIIVVPPHVNWFHQNFSIAHELGHFASGNLEPIEAAPVAVGQSEVAANAYAIELLLPAQEMLAVDWSSMAAADIANNLWLWGVSTDAVKRRLAALRIVPADEVREVLNMSTQKALRRHWTNDDSTMWVDSIADRMERANTRRFPTELIRAHMEGVASGRLQSNYLAWMLGTDAAELESELSPGDDSPDMDWLMDEVGLERPSSPIAS